MVSFETASLVLLAAALCTAAGVLPLDTALAPAAGTLLALAALAGQRASNSRPGGQTAGSLRGRLLLLLLLAALGGGTALCVLLFTGTAAQALTALTGWLRELASGALALLDRFFRWLFSLFPAPETGSLNLPDPISAAGGPAGEAVQSSDAVLYVLAGLVLLAGVGAILWALRRGGSRTRSPPSGPQGPRRGPPQPTGHPGNAVVPAGGPRPLPAHLPGPAEYPRRRAGVAGPPPEAPPQGPPAGGDLPRLPGPGGGGAARLCPRAGGAGPLSGPALLRRRSPRLLPSPSLRAPPSPAPGLPSAGEARTALTPPSAPRDLPVESPGALFLPFHCPVGQKNSCKRKNASNFPENTLSFSSCL